jgi:trk system potassium uptake protein TrkH
MEKSNSILYVIGIVLIIVGFAMVLPLLFAVFLHEVTEIATFSFTSIITMLVGYFIYRTTDFDETLFNKEAILIGAVGWLIVPIFACLPFIFSGVLPNWVDAYFEAVSGFTTTGATVITDIEIVSKSILIWRSFTQWLGGMGIILVCVAIISKMGVGGIRLLQAEIPGPIKVKVVPRISTYAKAIWLIYIAFTIIEVILLMLAGLDFYESLNHSFTSIATGGFSTRNGGIGAFNNPMAEAIITLFLIIGGGNFALYYLMIIKKEPFLLFKDEEYRAYLLLLLFSSLLICGGLMYNHYDNLVDALRYGIFQVVSMTTGTGHVTFDYDKWTNFAKMVLLLLMFFGGCQYSTTGGIKIVRMLIASKFIRGELIKIAHPRIVHEIRINKTCIDNQVAYNVIGYFLLYFLFFFITALVLSSYNLDIVSALTGSAAIIGNVGPAMGVLGPTKTYAGLSGLVKLWLSLTMILGRLEVYPVLVLVQALVVKK